LAANNPKAEIHRSARGTDIATQIPFRLFTSHRPREGFLSATGATYLLYGLMAVLWLYLQSRILHNLEGLYFTRVRLRGEAIVMEGVGTQREWER